MLWFKTKERAETAFQNIQLINSAKVDVVALVEKDDFGAILSIPVENISHCILNDMTKQAELYKMLEGAGLAKKN